MPTFNLHITSSQKSKNIQNHIKWVYLVQFVYNNQDKVKKHEKNFRKLIEFLPFFRSCEALCVLAIDFTPLTHLYLALIYNAPKTTIFSARCLCHVESFRASKAIHLAEKIVVLSALNIKQIKNVMKYQLYTNSTSSICIYATFFSTSRI